MIIEDYIAETVPALIERVKPVVVDRSATLQELLSELHEAPRIGVDTESNGLYRYHERVCLVQISSEGEDYVVDPLAVDIHPLEEVLASHSIEKVFHAAEYDIMCLKRDYGFQFANLFDTMVAGRLLGMRRIGLAGLAHDLLGADLDKRMQQADWGHRPLDEGHLQYAALDSHYLISLRHELAARLLEAERWQEAQESFAALCSLGSHRKCFDPDGYRKLRGAGTLDRLELSVLRQLYCWREETASAIDRPPFRVASNDTLVKLAMLQPRSPEALKLVADSRSSVVTGRSHEVLAAISRGIKAPRRDNGSSPE